jgi:hypothetical protein
VYPADNQEYANGVLWWKHGEPEPTKLKSNQIDIKDLFGRNIIYKIHGSIQTASERWDSFVVTEEDYIRFLSRMNNAVPAAFREFFGSRAFLFLGYGLKDWNLRVLLKEVSDPKTMSWAILLRPSALEQQLWRRRNVNIFDMRLEDFVAQMERRLNDRGL